MCEGVTARVRVFVSKKQRKRGRVNEREREREGMRQLLSVCFCIGMCVNA